MDRLNADVLQTLQNRILQPSIIVEAVQQALEEIRPSKTDQVLRRESVTQQIASLDLELRHYGDAIATAGPLPTLLSSIQERERRKTALQHELWELDSLEQIGRIDETKLAEQIEFKLRTQWQKMTESEKHVTIVRQLLRHTLVGRVRVGLQDASHYVIAGKATFVPLLDGMVPKCVASPIGT